MAKISTAEHVESTAYALLRQQGFTLHAIESGAGSTPLLVASNQEHEFRGHSALEILGLIAVFQAYGEDWHPTEDDAEHRFKYWDSRDEDSD
ncbi:hypothetical protein [Roseibium salinum]|uniref:Uncharacterized protein n=1 Tax=Roseibium salinum TaxID=1604349 RepID=A0ABT3QZ92_9HYPH|nr:hypothetical protein [Roseibium sp. DSM 29163]MCX2722161.1 hypothetical protein [Roseibium sp. DSM 29163]MDN3719825.1 hypothetical protein [Roseibium salinum]